MGREGRETVLEDKTDVVTTRKETGSWSMGEEVRGTPTSYIPQGLMGWEGKEEEVTLIAQTKGPRG